MGGSCCSILLRDISRRKFSARERTAPFLFDFRSLSKTDLADLLCVVSCRSSVSFRLLCPNASLPIRTMEFQDQAPPFFLPCCPRTSSKTDCGSAESLLRSLLSLPPSQPDDRKPRIYIPMTTGLPLFLLWYLGKVCRKRRRKEEGRSGDDCRKIGVEWGREACGYIALPSTEGRKGAAAEVGREGSPWSTAAFSVSGRKGNGTGMLAKGERPHVAYAE